jgi:hypothetical protein
MGSDDDIVKVGDRAMIYDREGKPCTTAFWRERINDDSYRVLAQDKVGEVAVSTIWLGLDHGIGYMLGADVPPMIFETMIFPGNSSVRYATEEQARAGHAKALAALRARSNG